MSRVLITNLVGASFGKVTFGSAVGAVSFPLAELSTVVSAVAGTVSLLGESLPQETRGISVRQRHKGLSRDFDPCFLE